MKNFGKIVFIIIFFFCSALYGADNTESSLRIPLIYQNSEGASEFLCKSLMVFLSLISDIKKEIMSWHSSDENSFVTDEEANMKLFIKLEPIFAFYYYYSRHVPDSEKYMNSIKAMLDIIDGFEPDREQGHTERVAWLVIKLIEELKIQDSAESIVTAAVLHDLGKIFFPDTIFKSDSPGLTESQDKFRKSHPVWGAMILKLFPVIEDVALIVRHHHERYSIEDGYPDQLKGEAIPFGSRIISVADVMDALLSHRAYDKEKRSLGEVVVYIKERSGKWFDPSVVDALLRLYERGELQIYENENLDLINARHVVIEYLDNIHNGHVIRYVRELVNSI